MGLVRAWRRTPLWLRLISATLVLVALGLTLTGAFGVRLLRGYLVDRVDEQLAEAVHESERRNDVPQSGGPSVPSQFDLTLLDEDGNEQWNVSSALTPSRPDLPDLAISDADGWANARSRSTRWTATDGGGSWHCRLPTARGRWSWPPTSTRSTPP